MKLKCPVCGEVLEVDVELTDGRHIRCAACGRIFAYRIDMPRRSSNPAGLLSGFVVILGSVIIIGAICWFLHRTNRVVWRTFADDDSSGQSHTAGGVCSSAQRQKSPQGVIKYYGDPLDEYQLGQYNSSGQEDFAMRNFLFFNTMNITYTSKGRIALITLTVNDSERLAVVNTDYIINSLMKRCNEKFGPIEWIVKKQSSGGKCAKGRSFSRGEIDKIFVLDPSESGGFKALLFSVRAKREDDGYKYPERLYERLPPL